MSVWAKVKVPGDIYQLADCWHVSVEPPYWYLRCRGCDQREYLPWDARMRIQDAVEGLLRHGRECAKGTAEHARESA